MNATIENKPAMRAAGLRHIGPYNTIGEAFSRLGAIAGQAGLYAHPGAAMIAIYHDDPQTVPADELRSDAAIVVPEGVPIPAGLTEQRVPAGRYACTIHAGPYDTLPDTWKKLSREWVPSQGLRIGAPPSYERYINNPMQVAPADLRTEVCVPLA